MMRAVVFMQAILAGVMMTGLVRADDLIVPSITVDGVGEVNATPDTAHVTVGVVTDAATAGEALKQNSQRMAELIKTLKGLGIEEKSIQTSNFNVSPRRNFDQRGKQPPEILGYTVTNLVTVKVRGIDRLGPLLDSVVQAGSNQVQGISFSFDDPQKLLDQARQKAIEDARHRAEVYAAATGVKVGPVKLIREQGVGVPRPMMAAPMMRGMAAEGVPIAAGEQSITANVNVTFAIAE